MTFNRKVILLLLIVAVFPAAVAGALSTYSSQKEMTAKIDEFHRTSATLIAQTIDNFFADAVKAVQLSSELIPFEEFPREDLADAVRIVCRQFEFVNGAVLLDENGEQLADPVFQSRSASRAPSAGGPGMTEEDLALFGLHIPFVAALKNNAVFGPPYYSAKSRGPRIALAVRIPLEKVDGSWVLAVELSLEQIIDTIESVIPSERTAAFVVDREKRVVYHRNEPTARALVSLADLAIIPTEMAREDAVHGHYREDSGREMTGAFAWIPVVQWGLVVAQPTEDALVSVNRMRTYILIWVGLGIALALFGGLLFSRGVTGPVRDLAQSAERLAKEDFDQRIVVHSKDEIGQLAESFNQMAKQLKTSFEMIKEKNAEIIVWNATLQKKVEERTRELKEAQEQIVLSQKLGAVGELAAGIAHEISNPLTGILGYAQLLLRKAGPEDESLSSLNSIADQAKRIQSIISELMKFSQSANKRNYGTTDLNWVVTGALKMAETQLEERHIEVSQSFNEDLPGVPCDSVQLQQAVLHIITNAKNAMPEGGKLMLRTNSIEGGAIKLEIEDTGVGMPKENLSKIFDPFFTTKRDWDERGLGLSVASRIVQEHDGKITVDSQLGKGSVFTIILPGFSRKSHLSQDGDTFRS